MPLSRADIRKRLAVFARDWRDAANEKSQAQTFWLRFYECFGIRAESATIYEQSVRKLGGAQGFIDSFIPGKLIVEHKSKGKDLDAAFDQAAEYFLSLKEAERPRYIVTSDFTRIRLYDLQAGGGYRQCPLADLPKKADWFMFLVEDVISDIVEESEADRNAAYSIGRLHEALLRANFKGRDLETLLIRLLFCLFADDTGIFGENGIFRRLLEATREDGADTGRALAELFQVLDTPEAERQHNLDDDLARFAYVNGRLFAEPTRIPGFDRDLREQLLACARLDWSGISPAIFGAMFQGVLEAHDGVGGVGGDTDAGTSANGRKASRRELGAHYTSERNILRLIDPLCMNVLRAELNRVRRNKKLLQAFYDKLSTLRFFDPACGCGNFLVIAYRELRQIEMDAIEAMTDAGLTNAARGGLLDVSTLCRIKVSQFYGIEIDDAAAHIARVALWITDHQMNLAAAERFGTTRPTVPLVDSPNIVCGNALRLDWREVLPPAQCAYLLGNPPFVGAKYMNAEQRDDVAQVLGKLPGGGLLDYVSCWYVKALPYLQINPVIRAAFVSTNSITQGEQVAVLWGHLLAHGAKIHFAHRTFQWSNEGKGVAAVHCVIVGFGLEEPEQRTIFDYGDNIKGEPTVLPVGHINPYLVDAPDVMLPNRQMPLCPVPQIGIGNKPIDGGNYLFTAEEKAAFLAREPAAAPWFRRWVGADEFINGYERWCLWLGDCPPDKLRAMPEALKRVEAVRKLRLASKSAPTQKLAATPTRFHVENIPDAPYLLVPRVSSERRTFIPIGFMQPDTFTSDTSLVVPHATPYHFGILTSTMHNAWTRSVCGRLESRYRYSAGIVYNNFPWPEPTEARRAAVAAAAQGVLDARAGFAGATLADLYDPLAMPPALVKAHAALDRAVDAAYAYQGGQDDAARVGFLFARYQRLTSLLPAATKPARTTKATKATQAT